MNERLMAHSHVTAEYLITPSRPPLQVYFTTSEVCVWIRTRADTGGQVHSLVALRLRGISAEADADSGPNLEGVDCEQFGKEGCTVERSVTPFVLVHEPHQEDDPRDYPRWDYQLITPCYSG